MSILRSTMSGVQWNAVQFVDLAVNNNVCIPLIIPPPLLHWLACPFECTDARQTQVICMPATFKPPLKATKVLCMRVVFEVPSPPISSKDAPIRSSQLRRGRTVHLEFSSSTDTQLPTYIHVSSWSENWTVYQGVSLARSWLFLAVRASEHNFSNHHHHHLQNACYLYED